MRQSMLNDQTLSVSELFQLGFLVCFLLLVSVVIITECVSSMKWWVTWDPEVVYRAQKMASSSQLLSFVRHGRSDRYKNPQECLWLTSKEDPLLLSLHTRDVINKCLIYIWFKRHTQIMASHFVPLRDLRYSNNLNIQDQFSNRFSSFLFRISWGLAW